MHEVLDRAYDKGDLPIKFFAIVDKDYDRSDDESATIINRFEWGVYHIENYLLHPESIAHVVSSFGLHDVSTDDVIEGLRVAARASVPNRLRHRLTAHASRALTRNINLSFNPAAEDLSREIAAAVDRSIDRISALHSSQAGVDSFKTLEEKERTEIEKSFADGSWMTSMPGREIIKQYVNTLPNGISYDVFKNMVLRRFVDVGYRPLGMLHIIELILKS